MSLIALVTGGTGFIGTEIVRQIVATARFHVVLGCRNQQSAEETVAAVSTSTNCRNLSYQLVDTSSHSSIKSLATRWQGPLHVLVNCASIVTRTRQETADGIELQFATNVLGYFWLTTEFADILKASAPSRIVNVASTYAGSLDLDDPLFVKRTYDHDSAYQQSKQAERMLTVAFAKRFDGSRVSVNGCHPGECDSKLNRALGYQGYETAAQGAATPAMLATGEVGGGETGQWFEYGQKRECRFAGDGGLIDKLYDYCAGFR
jgi:NAD(P)-dependent dehydrogenase (short-subunit alcohol dehydrogenase family)